MLNEEKSFPRFEEVTRRVVSDSRFLTTGIICSLLCFIPILNFFAFGMLYRYARQIRQGGGLQLPEWDNLLDLFFDGLKLFAFLLVYFFVPLLLAYGVTRALDQVPFLEFMSFASFHLILFMAPTFFLVALILYLREERLDDLLNFERYFTFILAARWYWLLPSILFTFLVLFLKSLWGFSFFLGFTVLIPYYCLVIMRLEEKVN